MNRKYMDADRLVPGFRFSRKMGPYVDRLRPKVWDFAITDRDRAQQFDSCRKDMVLILTKKRIPSTAVVRAVAEALRAAVRLQFALANNVIPIKSAIEG
jgi:hypothetical protein